MCDLTTPAVALNPELLEPVRARYRQWQSEAEQDGLEPGLGTLLRLAMDGLWLADLLDLAPPGAQERQALAALVGRLSSAADVGPTHQPPALVLAAILHQVVTGHHQRAQ